MSTSDFTCVKVMDNRIGCITPQIKYGVIKGAQSLNPQSFLAISASTSSHVYNIQCPSENTLIDRRCMWKSKVTLNIKLCNNSGGALTVQQMIGYGGSSNVQQCSLSPFPLHQLCTVMTSTINNTSVSINIRDVLPLLLRFNDRRELSKYNSTTPTAFDVYQKYSDAIGTVNNPMGSFSNAADNDLVPRGAFPVEFTLLAYNGGAIPSWSTSIPSGVTDNSVVNFNVSFTSVEPLLLSPWMFSDPTKYNSQAIYGVQNLNFNFNIGDTSRVWRTTAVPTTAQAATPANTVGMIGLPTFVGTGFQDSQLLFNFLTTHPSDMLEATNVVPFYETPRYTTVCEAIPAGDKKTVISQTLSLNQIPDKIVLCVRKTMGMQKNNDSDCYLPIDKVNIQFNNNSGILSSATQTDLYQMAVKNGSNQNWYEFSGQAYSGSSSAGGVVNTSGSIVILQFGTDINLVEDYYSCGSLGNFQINVQLSVTNNTTSNIDASSNPYEVVMMVINSGVFVTSRGSSSVYTGILSKAQVLEASAQPAYTQADVQRLIGGSFFDTLKSIAGTVKDVISPIASTLGPVAKGVLGAIPDPRAQMASKALGALGMGQSGGRKDSRLM